MDIKIANDYREEGQEILLKMIKVLMRAQKKVDDVNYRETLNKLKKI